MEEIYKDLNSPQIQEFEKLLNKEFSKTTAKEGDITKGIITKITDKMVYIELPNSMAKSEGMLDINELKLLKEHSSIKIGDTIEICIEKLEDKFGNVVISRERAKKIKSWRRLELAYENKEEVTGVIESRIKGGFVVTVENSACFLPGSQVDLKPLKNIDHLMSEPQRFLIVKCDKLRGNVVLSRRAILENLRNASKDKIISRYKVGDIVEGICKGMTAYGVFFDIDGFDCMCHINHVSWSRIQHPDELFSIQQKQKLKIIAIDAESKKISVSIKELTPDPFETNINNYKVGKKYSAVVRKIMNYGMFVSLDSEKDGNSGLEGLVHASELSHKKKNESALKLFTINQKIMVSVKEIDIDKRRISLSYKDTIENPWTDFQKKTSVGSKVKCKIKNITDFALFVDINNTELDGMVHYKDLNFSEDEKELTKFSKNQELELQILEINKEQEKIRLGLKQLKSDPLLDFFKNKSKKDVLTVTIREIVDNGIKVSPDNYDGLFLIKKNQIAIDKEDQRVSRFTKGDRLDSMISECDLSKRKVSLSIKMLEEEENKTAIKKYGHIDSGKSLPFANLHSDLKQKDKNKKE